MDRQSDDDNSYDLSEEEREESGEDSRADSADEAER